MISVQMSRERCKPLTETNGGKLAEKSPKGPRDLTDIAVVAIRIVGGSIEVIDFTSPSHAMLEQHRQVRSHPAP